MGFWTYFARTLVGVVGVWEACCVSVVKKPNYGAASDLPTLSARTGSGGGNAMPGL